MIQISKNRCLRFSDSLSDVFKILHLVSDIASDCLNSAIKHKKRQRQSIAKYWKVLQSVKKYYKVLQSITKYYNVLQSITTYYKVLNYQHCQHCQHHQNHQYWQHCQHCL